MIRPADLLPRGRSQTDQCLHGGAEWADGRQKAVAFMRCVPCCSNVGLLQVTVVEARDLDKQDLIGKSDPLVECWTQRLHVEATVRFSWNLV